MARPVPHGPEERAFFTSQLRTQLEYYFSPDNLYKDHFLRNQMDAQGFVPLQVLAEFNRVKYSILLGQDPTLLIRAIQTSDVLQFDRSGLPRVRRRPLVST